MIALYLIFITTFGLPSQASGRYTLFIPVYSHRVSGSKYF